MSDLLVSADWLRRHLDDPDLRVFDSTVHLLPTPELDIQSGRDDYERGHVPGAGFLDLVRELAEVGSGMAFTRPSRATLESVLSRAGIDRANRVVVYSTESPMWATRAWWLLRSAGVEAVSVLDGGFAQWCAAGHPVSKEPCTYPETRFVADPDESMWAGRDGVLAAIGQGAACTLNALPRALHTGEVSLGYTRAGRIRGSVNVPFSKLIDPETSAFRPSGELREHFDEANVLERERVITYCGGGIAATLNAFALLLLDHPDVAVYDGSLDEWSRDPELPMDRGD